MFKIYFCELVLGFLPDRNQTTAEMFSGKWIWTIIEKKFKFHLRFAKGRKNVRKRRGQFHLNSYTLERNEISSPNSGNMCMTLIFGQIKKLPRFATWWRYKMGKTVTHKPLVRITWNLVYIISVQSGTKHYKDICISQKTWPPLAKPC